MSLRQQALSAGAVEELDSTDFEVFAHGTSASFADRIVATQGGCLSETGGKWGGRFFTVPDPAVALVFAKRTAGNTREVPKIVALALSREKYSSLRSRGLVSFPPIQGPPPGVSPNTPQFVFEQGALQELKRFGFFFIVK